MRKIITLLVGTAIMLSGCAGAIPKDALQLRPESLADRQMQTRRFETANHEAMLNAAAAVFQDIGFSLEESEYSLGVLVGSKQRDATSGAQVAGAVFLAALTGAVVHVDKDQTIRASMVMREIVPADAKQQAGQKLSPEVLQQVKKEMTSLLTTGLRKHFPNDVSEKLAVKIADSTAKTLTSDLAKVMRTQGGGESTVRVTFQRVIYNTAGQVTTREQINEPTVYQEFFDRLSQAVFLEAHEL